MTRADPSASGPAESTDRPKTWEHYAVGVGLLVLGLGIIGFHVWILVTGVQDIARRQHLAGDGVRVTATVVDREEIYRGGSRGGGGSLDHYVDYRFTALGEEAPRRRDDVQISEDFYDSHPPGSRVQVAYDRDDPSRSEPVALLDSLGVPATWMLLLYGCGASAIGGAKLAHRVNVPPRGGSLAIAGLLLGGLAGWFVMMRLFKILAAIVY